MNKELSYLPEAEAIEQDFPRWEAWVGLVNGLWHARRKGATPPVMVHDDSPAGIREQDQANREAVMSEIEPRHVKPPSVSAVAYAGMTTAERFWWVVCNIATLGYPWWRKSVMKRAFLEALIAHDRLYQPAPYLTPAPTPDRSPYVA